MAVTEMSTHNPLTNREREVLALMVKGLTNKEIGEKLVIRKCTVQAHVSHIYSKIYVTNRVQAARWATENGIFEDS